MNYTTWEQRVRKVEPYTPGEQPKTDNVIKLNTNENPFPPSPMVEKVIKEYNEDALRLYPDTRAGLLVDALAKRYGVDSNQVFVGVGSDDVISQTFLTFFNSDKEILFPDITYSFYDVWADLYRIPYRTVPLKDDFTIDPDDYKCDNGGIIIPNPNAPTGVLESLDTIEEILKANPTSVVVIDEAYIDFGGTSCLPLIDKYENLLVVQTFEFRTLHAVDDTPRTNLLLLVKRSQLALLALLLRLQVSLDEVLSHNECCRLAAVEVVCLNSHVVDLRTNAESHV